MRFDSLPIMQVMGVILMPSVGTAGLWAEPAFTRGAKPFASTIGLLDGTALDRSEVAFVPEAKVGDRWGVGH